LAPEQIKIDSKELSFNFFEFVLWGYLKSLVDANKSEILHVLPLNIERSFVK